MTTVPSTDRVDDEVVPAFAARVRALLADLTAQERDELAGDLEADLADLVADRGPGALPDPETYARELRVAAGFAAEAGARADRTATRARLLGLLDGSRERWLGAVTGLPGEPWEVLVALRPVWWVFRAWVALSLVDLVLGSGAYNLQLAIVPSLLGWGAPLLALAVLLSVLIGLGRLWPGGGGNGRGGLTGRLVLLLLNALAVVVAPLCVTSVTTPQQMVDWGYDARPDPAEVDSVVKRPLTQTSR